MGLERILVPRAKGGTVARVSFAEPASLLWGFAWLSTIAFTGALLAFARQEGCFFGDDFSTFSLAQQSRLPDALLVPLGSQIVPLHRALAFFMYSAAPLDWAAALVLLVAFHALGVVYLYRVLELVYPTRINAVIVAAYATNVFAGLQFMWFSAGLARAPYVLFALMAIYHYMRFSETRHGLHAIAVGACYIAAIGFYPKGVLIPMYCLGLEVAWRGRAALRIAGHTDKWALLGVLTIASAAYIPLAATADELASKLVLDVLFQVKYLKRGFAVLAFGAFGGVLSPLDYPDMAADVGALWCIFAGYSIYRVRSNWVPWVVGLGLIGLNIVMIGVSNRAFIFGDLVAFAPRYQFELYFLMFLFLGVVIQRLRASAPPLPARPTSALSLLGALVLTQHAVVAYAGFRRVAVPSPAACSYLANLRAGMDRLSRSAWTPAHIRRRSFSNGAESARPPVSSVLAAVSAPAL